MIHPDIQYFDTPVGAQLLKHYAGRDAVRHAAPLMPLRHADVMRFIAALMGRNRPGASAA